MTRNEYIGIALIILWLLWRRKKKDVIVPPIAVPDPTPGDGRLEPGGGDFGGAGAGGSWFAPPVEQNTPTPATRVPAVVTPFQAWPSGGDPVPGDGRSAPNPVGEPSPASYPVDIERRYENGSAYYDTISLRPSYLP